MPRDAAGVFTLVPGYLAVTGQTIEASQHNPPLEDIAAALTGSLPRNGSAGMLAPLNMGAFRAINVGAPTADADAATKAYVDTAIAGILSQVTTVPPGFIGPFSGDTVPTGWLLCNGSAISRAEYAALFAAIGTKYGAGDGSTTFNIPEIRGEFFRFADMARGVDPGRSNGSFQGQDIQSHAHGVNDPGHAHGYDDSGAGQDQRGAIPPSYTATAIPGVVGRATNPSGTGISIQAAGGSETRPRNIAFLGIIKV